MATVATASSTARANSAAQTSERRGARGQSPPARAPGAPSVGRAPAPRRVAAWGGAGGGTTVRGGRTRAGAVGSARRRAWPPGRRGPPARPRSARAPGRAPAPAARRPPPGRRWPGRAGARVRRSAGSCAGGPQGVRGPEARGRRRADRRRGAPPARTSRCRAAGTSTGAAPCGHARARRRPPRGRGRGSAVSSRVRPTSATRLSAVAAGASRPGREEPRAGPPPRVDRRPAGWELVAAARAPFASRVQPPRDTLQPLGGTAGSLKSEIRLAFKERSANG